MRATQAEITVANRLLKFNGINAEIKIVGNEVIGTGQLTGINHVKNIQELSAMYPAYFRPFYLPEREPVKNTIRGQQTLF